MLWVGMQPYLKREKLNNMMIDGQFAIRNIYILPWGVRQIEIGSEAEP